MQVRLKEQQKWLENKPILDTIVVTMQVIRHFKTVQKIDNITENKKYKQSILVSTEGDFWN